VFGLTDAQILAVKFINQVLQSKRDIDLLINTWTFEFRSPKLDMWLLQIFCLARIHAGEERFLLRNFLYFVSDLHPHFLKRLRNSCVNRVAV
jgi:hypothetical protein